MFVDWVIYGKGIHTDDARAQLSLNGDSHAKTNEPKEKGKLNSLCNCMTSSKLEPWRLSLLYKILVSYSFFFPFFFQYHIFRTMIDFTKEASQSLISTSSSAMSNSLMNASSISRASSFSQSSSESEPFNLKFITEDQKYFSRLMEDLSIVDNMCDVFDYDTEASNSFGKPKRKKKAGCTRVLTLHTLYRQASARHCTTSNLKTPGIKPITAVRDRIPGRLVHIPRNIHTENTTMAAQCHRQGPCC